MTSRPERRLAALARRWATAQTPVERLLAATRSLRGVRKHPTDPATAAEVDRELDELARRAAGLVERLLTPTPPQRGDRR